MKKLFISIFAAFVFILSCIIPFTASAEISYDVIDAYFVSDNHVVRNDTDNYYIGCIVNQTAWDGTPNPTNICIVIPKNSTISFENDILTINDVTNLGLTCYYSSNIMGQWSATGFRYFTINYANNSIYAEKNSGGYYFNNLTFSNYSDTLGSITNPTIEVEVFPDLTENFNYSAEFEGNQVPLSAIQVDINNETAKNYQYAILIQPHGSFLEYESHSNSRNMSIFWGDSPVTYAYMKDEWFYAPFGFANTLNETGRSDTELIMAPCAWHHVAAHSSSRDHLYFEQMQLKKGESYDFKVLVFDLTTHNTDGFPNDLPHCTASPYIEVVYNQTFSVLSDTNFNPDSNANGAYSYDNTLPLDTQFDKVKAYYEQSDTVGGIGQVKVTDGADFGNMYDTHNQAASGSSYSSSSYYNSSGSNISFNSLIANSSSFLSLLKNVLRYMPDWLSVLLFGGLLAFVLAAIWRKL